MIMKMRGVKRGYEHQFSPNFNFQKSPLPSILFRSGPPASAIDRFLQCHKNNNSNNNINNNNSLSKTEVNQNATLGYPNGGFSSSWATMQELNFVNGLFGEGDGVMNQNALPRNNMEENPNGNNPSKKRKGKDSSPLIKGQWTEQEDSMLMELVAKYGTKKWSVIAEKLDRRAGKQCRERWHNHLRPDIKKDTWSEEEERMLVQAHMQFGNKWAEIAKQIPGRTENSIKNHWNATKRRQNSKRWSNKTTNSLQSGKKTNQPSLLQEYIKSKTLATSSNGGAQSPSTTAISDTNTAPSTSSGSTAHVGDPLTDPRETGFVLESSEHDQYFESPLLDITNPSHDDELVFMKTFLSNYDDARVNPQPLDVPNHHHHLYYPSYGQQQLTPTEGSYYYQDTNNNNNCSTTSIVSDLMASLVDGSHQAGPVVSGPLDQGVMTMNLGYDSLRGKKDMDLVEMILSSQF